MTPETQKTFWVYPLHRKGLPCALCLLPYPLCLFLPSTDCIDCRGFAGLQSGLISSSLYRILRMPTAYCLLVFRPEQMNNTHPARPNHVGHGISYRLGYLPSAAFPSHLPQDLGNLADTRRPYRMADGY